MKKSVFPYWLLLVFTICFLPACKTVKPADAELALRLGEYDKAANFYNTLFRRTPQREPELRAFYSFKRAEALRHLGNPTRSLPAYRNALRYQYPDSIVPLRIAEALLGQGKYSEAAKAYQSYLEARPMDYFARIGLQSCYLGLKEDNLTNNYKVTRAAKWNSAKEDFSATYAPDGSAIYFSSSRSSDPEAEISDITGLKTNDIFIIKKDAKGNWGKPDSISGGLNTLADEGTPALSQDGRTLYYTYAERDDHYHRTARIHTASSSGEGGWGAGQPLDVWRDTTTLAGHPALSPSGKWLYFVSDGGSTLGGKDIFRCQITEQTMGSPENLGSEINTIGDEMFPYLLTDSILYFSSNGRVGYGGLDIYRAELDPTGHWQVENLGRPINSSADDYGFVLDPSKKGINDPMAERGLITSTRGDGHGRPHLYTFERPAILTFVEGFVYNRDEEPIASASVRIVGEDGEPQPGVVYTRQDGSFRIRLEEGTDYVMLAGAERYLNQYARFQTDTTRRNETYYVDFFLSSRFDPEALHDIYYDFDKATLRPESKKSLDFLISVLVDNPDVSIMLSAHADRIGSDTYNIGLSQRRAESVVQYLTEAGISPERLIARGYGKSRPYKTSIRDVKNHAFLVADQLLNDSLILSLQPKERAIADQLNRRTEFRVLDKEELKVLQAEQKAKEEAEESQVLNSAQETKEDDDSDLAPVEIDTTTSNIKTPLPIDTTERIRPPRKIDPTTRKSEEGQ